MLPLVLRLVFALAMVAGLLWIASRIARKRGLGGASGVVQVLARQPLSRSSAVCVVKVADRVLIVGTSEQRVTLLGETDLAAVEECGQPARPGRATDVARAVPSPLPASAGAVTVTPVAPAPAPGALASAGGPSVVAGSVLDHHQWSALVGGLREKTVRR